MKSTIIGIALTVGGLAGLSGLATAAQASPAGADVTVTITAEGTDMSGVVDSSNPALCAAHRTVKVYRVVNGKPHSFASDTTDRQGDTWVWSTGNTGTEGRFFAKVAAKTGCNAAVSPIIRVHR
jgi:hypothetical protein